MLEEVKMGAGGEPYYRVELRDEASGLRGFVVVHSLVNGFSAGGLRMHPQVTLKEIGRLAETMTYKFAAVGVPIGGGKSGIVGDPAGRNKKKLIQAFSMMIRPFLRSIYLAGEDMGINVNDVALLYGTAEINPISVAKERMADLGIKLKLSDDLDITDTEGNLEELLTGKGLAECVEEACRSLKMSVKGAGVSVQGFGTVGGSTALFLSEMGMKIVAVSDIDGVIYDPRGLPVERIYAAKDLNGRIDRRKLNFKYRKLPGSRWLEVDADILVPAAGKDVINRRNMDKIKARLIVEGANIPTTAEARAELHKRSVTVIPDFVANAGASCGFGCLMTGQVEYSAEKIYGEMCRRIRRATRRLLKESGEENITPRQAAVRMAERQLKKWAGQRKLSAIR